MISTNTNRGLFDTAQQGPLGTYPRSGDSGSPLFAYDTTQQEWVLVGVTSSGGGEEPTGLWWMLILCNRK
ncbi:S6 family peptidase [Escherichia coli]|uniref:S6 family peptidase n=1 Tax=Escherichia coli TaxID=562 RepID=UPI003974A393